MFRRHRISDGYPLDSVERRRWILTNVPPGGVGAEIGVFRGHFSVAIAEQLQPRKLYLVDPWTKLGESFGYGEISYTNNDMLTTRQALDEVHARMARFEGQIEVEIVEDYGVNFCAELTEPLDWAYLDAVNRPDLVLANLEAIDRVLLPHGRIMGDDWVLDPAHHNAGIMRAVNDFIRSHDYEILTAGYHEQWCLRRTPDYPST